MTDQLVPPTFTTTPPAPADAVPAVVPGGDDGQLELFMGEMTLGMIEDVEVALGYPMAEAQDMPGGPIRLAAAMIYVRRKVLDPAFTMEDARNLPPQAMIQFADAMKVEDDSPPVMP